MTPRGKTMKLHPSRQTVLTLPPCSQSVQLVLSSGAVDGHRVLVVQGPAGMEIEHQSIADCRSQIADCKVAEVGLPAKREAG